MAATRHSLQSILEAMLLVADRPIGLKKFTQLLPEYDRDAIITALKVLQGEYNNEKRGFELKEVAGGFRLQTRRNLRSWVLRLKKSSPVRLSRAALETLAVVAYRQPATRAEVESIRGVDASGTLHFLLDRKIIRIVGRKDLPGRPLLYGTTRQFLEVFELKDLSDLPSLAEMAELEHQTNGLRVLKGRKRV
ncbi:MAG: SMC-Scp complex subunit ScpB [Thermodesulfobacteriota bacterium]|nr:SMC-Scp complex subunit ScpB [Thermodesulfobacteriota bacterium]